MKRGCIPMKKAIAYIRVSTEGQFGDDKYGVDSQKQAILDFANEQGYQIQNWYIDKISGTTEERPELDKILYRPDELPQHEAVIVFKSDRIARDTKLYFYYFYTLEKRNIKLLSSVEQFDEGNDFANIYRSLLMFVAEQERKNIALRTSKGRQLKAQCGGYSGGNKPYGYSVLDGVLTINPSERGVVELIFKNKSLPLSDICDILQENGYKTRKDKRFQPSTVRSILQNEKFYQGFYKYGGSNWVKGVHTPILMGAC